MIYRVFIEETASRLFYRDVDGASPAEANALAATAIDSEEMEHIREGKHGARSTKQAIAIGLSKARRADVKLKPPKKGAGVGAHTQERGPRGLADGRPRNLRHRRIEPQHMRRRKTGGAGWGVAFHLQS